MGAKRSPKDFEHWLEMRDKLGVSAKEYEFPSEAEMREQLVPEAFEK